MHQDALGHSWRPPGRSWTLWGAPGSFHWSPGRPGKAHYACSVFCGSRMPPGRPRTLKHYACSVFWDGKCLECWRDLARRTPSKRIFPPFFHYLMNSHSENIFSVSYILHILTYSYVLSILTIEYIQTDWFGFIHKTVYTPRGTRPRRKTSAYP